MVTAKRSQRGVPTKRIRVLSFGFEKTLLEARHQVLAAREFAVTSIATLDQFRKLSTKRVFDVIIVGHAVPARVRNEIAQNSRQANRARVIFLYRGSISHAELADAVLNVDGPSEILIETIALLGNLQLG